MFKSVMPHKPDGLWGMLMSSADKRYFGLGIHASLFLAEIIAE